MLLLEATKEKGQSSHWIRSKHFSLSLHPLVDCERMTAAKNMLLLKRPILLTRASINMIKMILITWIKASRAKLRDLGRFLFTSVSVRATESQSWWAVPSHMFRPFTPLASSSVAAAAIVSDHCTWNFTTVRQLLGQFFKKLSVKSRRSISCMMKIEECRRASF